MEMSIFERHMYNCKMYISIFLTELTFPRPEPEPEVEIVLPGPGPATGGQTREADPAMSWAPASDMRTPGHCRRHP